MAAAERPPTPIPDPPGTATPEATDQTEPAKATSDSPNADSPSAEPEITSSAVEPGLTPSLAAALAFFDSAFPGPPEPPPEAASETDESAEPWTAPQRPLRSRPPPKPTQHRSAPPAEPPAETTPAEPSPTAAVESPAAEPAAAEAPAETVQAEPSPPAPAESPAAEPPPVPPAELPTVIINDDAPVEPEPAVSEPSPPPAEEAAPSRPRVESSAEDTLPTPPLPRPAAEPPARDTMELFHASIRRRSPLRFVLEVVSVVAAFGLGLVVNDAAERESAPAGSVASIVPPAPPPSASVAIAVEAPTPGADLSAPRGTRSASELAKLDPGKRTQLEAVALGREWSKDRLGELDRLARDLEKNPAGLEDPSVRDKLRAFVQDRLTSRTALERLADMRSPRALDLLYEIWTGSKDRTETTQLAEALLLAKDVRPRASPALEVALALREKPTDCAVVRELVGRAEHDADRRSAMLLVATGARKNCGEGGDSSCRKCLPDAEHLRKAIQAAAARPEPTGPQTPVR